MGTLDGGIQRVRVYTQNPAGRKPVRNSCVRFETSKHFWVVDFPFCAGSQIMFLVSVPHWFSGFSADKWFIDIVKPLLLQMALMNLVRSADIVIVSY